MVSCNGQLKRLRLRYRSNEAFPSTRGWKRGNPPGEAVLNRKRWTGEIKCDNRQLLPGIPDDLTITKICPKLSWPVLNNLTLVSHGWLTIIQNHEVFEARRFSSAGQIAFIIQVPMEASEAPCFAVYSVEDNSVCYLPPIPSCTSNRMLKSLVYTYLNGKLFVMVSLRGKRASLYCSEVWEGFSYLYMYDLAGHIGWKKCTNPRVILQDEFLVINGKIFVCSKSEDFVQNSGLTCRIYDPLEDVWTPISADDCADQKLLAGSKEDCTTGRSSRALFEKLEILKKVRFTNTVHPQELFYTPEAFTSGECVPAVAWIGSWMLKKTSYGIDVFNYHTQTWIPFHVGDLFEGIDLLFNEKKEILPVRYKGAAIVRDMIFSMVEVILPSRERSLHIWRSKAVASYNHQEISVKGKNAHGEWKQLKFSCISESFLKCPVRL